MHRAIEQIEQGIYNLEDSEGETAMGRLGNYSATDYRPARSFSG